MPLPPYTLPADRYNFTREEILSHIWDSAGNFVNDNTLTVTMKRLRDKIGDKEGNIIVTVRGVGYRLSD